MPLPGALTLRIKRLLFFLVPGIILCAAGVVLMFCGAMGKCTRTQIGGVIFYGAAIPLLLQAKLIKMSDRVKELERLACRKNGGKACVGSRYADDEEE